MPLARAVLDEGGRRREHRAGAAFAPVPVPVEYTVRVLCRGSGRNVDRSGRFAPPVISSLEQPGHPGRVVPLLAGRSDHALESVRTAGRTAAHRRSLMVGDPILAPSFS